MLIIVIILTISMLIMTEKDHKRPLNISFDFDFQTLKDSITFINHIFHRNKFKRFKHSSPSSSSFIN